MIDRDDLDTHDDAPEPRVDRVDRSGSMQLHVPSHWDEARVLEFAFNNSHPSMAKRGYRIRGADDPRLNGTPARAVCGDHEGFDRVIVDPVDSPVPVVFTLTEEESEQIERIIRRRPGYTEADALVAREIWWTEQGLARGIDPETLGSHETNPYKARTFFANPLTEERRAELEKGLAVVKTWQGLSKEFDHHAEFEAMVEPLLKEAFNRLDALGIPFLFDCVTARIDGEEGEVVKGTTLVRLPPTRAMRWQKKAGDLCVNKPTESELADLLKRLGH